MALASSNFDFRKKYTLECRVRIASPLRNLTPCCCKTSNMQNLTFNICISQKEQLLNHPWTIKYKSIFTILRLLGLLKPICTLYKLFFIHLAVCQHFLNSADFFSWWYFTSIKDHIGHKSAPVDISCIFVVNITNHLVNLY